MQYKLPLTNQLYLANLESYLKIVTDVLSLIEIQNQNFLTSKSTENNNIDWYQEASHFNNIDWLFLNSIFISMFSSFEFFLFKICDALDQRLDQTVKLKDISTNGGILDQYCRYMHLIGKIESANKQISPWDKIAQYKNLRNILVHNGGILEPNNLKELQKNKSFTFLVKHKVIMAGSSGYIRIKNDLILRSFVDETTILTNNVIKEFNTLYN